MSRRRYNYGEYTDHPYTLSKRAPYTHFSEVVKKYIWLRLQEDGFTARAVLNDFKTAMESALAEISLGEVKVYLTMTRSVPTPVLESVSSGEED